VPDGCDTETVSPAMRILPDRAGPVFAAALNPTVPLPLPPDPLVTVIQLD
jgi:hypothetical protein